MQNIGELIDALLTSEVDCLWLRMVCSHTDSETMAQFRALPIVKENMLIFSTTIAAQIRSYLTGVSTEDRYESILREGHKLFDFAWQLVKELGIPKEVVDVPISYVEIATRAGVVSVNSAGMVSLAARGEQMILDFKKA